jgi:hypothetical protein
MSMKKSHVHIFGHALHYNTAKLQSSLSLQKKRLTALKALKETVEHKHFGTSPMDVRNL